MFKSKTKLAALLIAIVMVVSLVGCTSSGTAPSAASTSAPSIAATAAPASQAAATTAGAKKWKVAYATKRWTGSEHWITVKKGLDSVIKPTDEYVFVDAQGNLETQVKQLEDLVAQKVDAIICAPRDPAGVVAVFEKIHAAGIKLITLDCSSNKPELEDACVKMDYPQTGKLCAENLLKAMNYKGKVLMYYDKPNVEANERANGFKEVAKQYPDVKIVEIDGFGTVDEALKKLEDALMANPDTAAVWGYNTAGAQAAISLQESMKMKFLITCVDATSVEVKNIREGRMLGGAAQFPYDMGAKAAEVMYKILNGEKVTSPVRLASEWVDKSNVEAYAKKMGF